MLWRDPEASRQTSFRCDDEPDAIVAQRLVAERGFARSGSTTSTVWDRPRSSTCAPVGPAP